MNHTATYPPKFPLPAMGGYRYFFNGQEADNEVLGEGGFQNYGFRMYDTRIARFWGVDPLTKDYPMLTPFQFASCSPILLIDMDGGEGIENTIGYTSNGVPFRYFNARQSTYVIPKALPKAELKKPVFKLTIEQQILLYGEIRPGLSEYARAWAESAGYFGIYIYRDPTVRAIATGGLAVTTVLFGTYVGSSTLPYAVRSGEQLYSFGLKVYNNPWGKFSIGVGTGWVANKQDWSPDICIPNPEIGLTSQYFQFLFSTLDKNEINFDINNIFKTKVHIEIPDNDEKSTQTATESKEKK